MKKVPWFFIGNKNLSVIRAMVCFKLEYCSYSYSHIVFVGEHTSIWNMMHQSEWCRQDLIHLDLYCKRRICIEHLWAFSLWTMMMNLNTNMNNNLTQMISLVRVCLLGMVLAVQNFTW